MLCKFHDRDALADSQIHFLQAQHPPQAGIQPRAEPNTKVRARPQVAGA
ncbi:hypothetical protein [Microcoleus sp. herbarium14]